MAFHLIYAADLSEQPGPPLGEESPHRATENLKTEAMDFLNDLLAEENTLPELMKKMTAQVEHSIILKMLEECQQNKTSAANRLGISYRTLLRKLEQIQGT